MLTSVEATKRKKVKTNNTTNNKADPLTISSNKNNNNDKKKSRMERVTLPVLVSLMRRTSREFWRTTILYSHVSVQGFTISTCSFSIANFPILGKNLKDYLEIKINVLGIKPRTNKYHKDKMPPFQKFVFYLLQKSIYQNPNSKIKLKKKNVKLKNQI